jgi:hypothetical protein
MERATGVRSGNNVVHVTAQRRSRAIDAPEEVVARPAAIARSAARTAKLAANKAAAAKGAPTAAPPPALASEGGKRIRRPRTFHDS